MVGLNFNNKNGRSVACFARYLPHSVLQTSPVPMGSMMEQALLSFSWRDRSW